MDKVKAYKQSDNITKSYKKIPYISLGQLLPHFELSEEAQAITDPQMSPIEALVHLRAEQLNIDAITLLAYSLPRSESIWWACQCLMLRQGCLSQVQIDCLNNAKLWLENPTEVLRRRSEYYAKRLGSDCGPGWLALAVFWNGSGSIIASGEPEVLPKAFLYAAAVAGAVNLGGVKPELSQSALGEYYRLVFQSGLDIAGGGLGVLASDALVDDAVVDETALSRKV